MLLHIPLVVLFCSDSFVTMAVNNDASHLTSSPFSSYDGKNAKTETVLLNAPSRSALLCCAALLYCYVLLCLQPN